MKNLYQFLEHLYSNFKDKEKTTFDKFIEGFMYDSIGAYSSHEAISYGHFLGDYNMSYEVDHENKQIDIFYEQE